MPETDRKNLKWGRSALHSVEVLDGVGPDLAGRLESAGLGTVEELASVERSGLRGVAAAIDGLSERQLLENLLPQAWFHLLGEDGAAAAKALVDEEIDSYLRLLAVRTNRVVNLMGPEWDRDRAAQLQLEASRAMWCFQPLLLVADGDGKPVKGPRVQVGGVGLDRAEQTVERTGDANGWLLCPPLRRDRGHHLSVVAGRARRSVYVRPTATQVQRVNIRLTAKPRARLDESDAQVRTRLLTGRETLVFDPVTRSRLKPGTPMRVNRAQGDGVPLTGIHRRVEGNAIVVTRIEVAPEDLPKKAVAGSVVIVDDNGFRMARAAELKRLMEARGAKLAGVET